MERLFEVETPIGIKVRTSSSYWQLIQQKHPDIKGKLDDLKETLQIK